MTRSATRAVRAGLVTDQHHHAVVPPIHLSANYAFTGLGQKGAYDYSRSGNPTRDLLASALAELEGGAGAVVTATGMAAVTLVLQLVNAGARVVAPHDCYGGTHRLLLGLARRGVLEVEFVDQRDLPTVERALAKPTRLVWIESPSNPLLRLTDLRAVTRLAHAAGALAAVDNTFLSPVLQRPIELGADLVVHSTTKYLNGHSDVVGGAVVAREAALQQEVAWWANSLGVTGSPFDSFLTLRGLRTLHIRMAQHLVNAAAVVDKLRTHPAVTTVHYPGTGAMVSFALEGGVPAVRRFLDGLTCFTLAESLGGVESLVAHPATMTHASMDQAARERAGIGDDLLRLSIGIEAAEDLVTDIVAGLDRAAAPRRARAPRAVAR
ncbi:MAG: cystathionine gamma-synthase [Gemmatimonadales bacterium]